MMPDLVARALLPRGVGALALWAACTTHGCGDGTHIDLGDPRRGDAAPDAPWDAASPTDVGVTPPADANRACADGSVPAAMTALLGGNLGFGRRASGGAQGCLVHVSTLADDGPGSLRAAAAPESGAAWIVFDVAGEITLASNLAVGSNKTIDARDKVVTLRDFGLTIDGAANVVIENLRFVGNDAGANNDGIHIANGAHDIWVDHCSLSNYGDEHIGVSHGATDVTISWSLMMGRNNGVLLGRSRDDVEDVAIRATLHHNWWNQVNNYAPRMRFGKVHLFDNLIDRWANGAAAVTMGGQLVAESNVFVASDNKTALAVLTGDDTVPGVVRMVANQFDNGAAPTVTVVDGGAAVFDPMTLYAYTASPASQVAAAVRAGAGAH